MNKTEIKAARLCIWCQKPRGIDGTASHCRLCAKKFNADCLARKKRKIAEGLCSACNKPRGPWGTNTHCQECAEKARNRSSKNSDMRLNLGLCAECKKPIEDAGRKRLCAACAPTVNKKLSGNRHKWRVNRAATGRCTECGGEREPGSEFRLCRGCRTSDNGKPWGSNKGVCHGCGGELDTNLRHCSSCLIRQFVGNAGLTAYHLPILLKKLKDQDNKCYYTGVPLVAGINLSIDHIIPKSSLDYPGNRYLPNIVWCDTTINKKKSVKSLEEFRKYCKLSKIKLVI